MIERKVCDPQSAQLKFLDDSGPGRLSGYASTFSNFDRVNERVVKGSFLKSLDTFQRDGFIALDHDWTKRIATIDVAREDDNGLYIEAEFHSTPDAQQERTKARERMERGKSVSLSIGYEVRDDEKTAQGRLLKELSLYEVSLVSVPANPLALVTGAKGSLVDGLFSYAEYEAAVVDAVKTFVRRAGARHEMREKAGRMFSAANLQTIDDLIQMLTELRGRATPPDANEGNDGDEPMKADADTVRAAVARMLAMHGHAINL